MKKDTELVVICGNCGHKNVVSIPEKSTFASGMTIAHNSGLGTIVLPTEDTLKTLSAPERRALSQITGGANIMDATKDLNRESLQKIMGIVTKTITDVCESDESRKKVSKQILASGTILEHHAWKQHVPAQWLKMSVRRHYWWNDDDSNKTDYFHMNLVRFGYDYTWRILIDMIHIISHEERNKDTFMLERDTMWYNKDLALAMMDDYRWQLRKRLLHELEVRKWKDKEYVPFYDGGKLLTRDDYNLEKGLLCCDIDNLLEKVDGWKRRINNAKSYNDLYHSLMAWNNVRPSLKYKMSDLNKESELYREHKRLDRENENRSWYYKVFKERNGVQSKMWQNAFKGFGAYWTMYSFIAFPPKGTGNYCFAHTNTKEQSLAYLDEAAKQAAWDNEGYRLHGLARNEFFKVNNIDIKALLTEWREAKRLKKTKK